MRIKVALPKGRLLEKTAALLQEASWGLDGYNKELRLYHIKSAALHNLAVKVFHEKDIPIQVAIGNYDLGICGLDWIEELLAKYPSSALLKVKDLGFGETTLYMTASPLSPQSLEQLKASQAHVRIASEYPNLAEAFALKNRFSRFSVFPVWGAAEAFPPENADLALISGKTEFSNGMVLVSRMLDSSAYLIA
ncbi:MAG: ATP phosphoribosyltransferase, partial [Dehalococcoidales bacterium]|nr:ATP phosphoribosyltransferase [Dehalococcoidales bacterium]